MQNIAGFDFFPLQYDGNGNLSNPLQFEALAQTASAATDVMFLAHGFCNDVNDATSLYTHFLTSLGTQFARPEFASLAPPRKFVVAGVFWPSKAYPESFPSDAGTVASIGDKSAQADVLCAKLRELEADATPEQKQEIDEAIHLVFRLEHDTDAQNRFARILLSLIPAQDHADDAMEGLNLIRTKSGDEVLAMLRHPVVIPVKKAPSGGGMGGVATVSTKVQVIHEGGVEGLWAPIGSVLGAAGTLANLTTWYQMKSRSGVVGETGLARAVRSLKTAQPGLKVHLVGHSLGGRLMAACARGLSQDPIVHPDSMTLLEAAFSHYGFSPNNGTGQRGFFRDALGKKVVSGPLLETFSALDSVVGYAYAIASRLAGDNVKALGDANDPYGGIGRNGAQKTPESVVERLHDVGAPYSFKSGVVTNLDGSGGLITSHSDISNDRVTYAVASAVATT